MVIVSRLLMLLFISITLSGCIKESDNSTNAWGVIVAFFLFLTYYIDKKFSDFGEEIKNIIEYNQKQILQLNSDMDSKIDNIQATIRNIGCNYRSYQMDELEERIDSVVKHLEELKENINKGHQTNVNNFEEATDEVLLQKPKADLRSFQNLILIYRSEHFKSFEDNFEKMCAIFNPPNDEILAWCQENLKDPEIKQFIRKYFSGWREFFPYVSFD